jgi:signal transduction histidine kinase/CheY-like chemotaxis protein
MPRTVEEAHYMAGDGVAARLMRRTAWEHTAVGAPAQWSATLKTMIGVMLNSRHPMFLWWGPALIQFYNDAYIPSFGVGKHPAAMGQRGAECWQEIWPIIWPQIDDVMARGKPSWNEDQLVPIFRNGHIEDVYWSYGYSPVLDDDGTIGGTLVICAETTSRMVAERRQRVVHALAETVAAALSRDDVALMAMDALASAPTDVPAALFFRRPHGEVAPLWVRGRGPGAADETMERADLALRHRLARVPADLVALAAGDSLLVPGLVELPGPGGPEPVTDVFLVPVRGAHGPALEFVAYGLNPRIPFDAGYQQFLVQLTGSISLAKARVDAATMRFDAERERNNLLQQAPIATAVLVGPDLVFQLANKLYCDIVGRQDLIGKRYIEAFPELVGTALPGVLETVYRTGVRYVSPETLIRLDRTGSGRVEDCYFQFNLEPMRTTAGVVYGLMAVAVDLTAQVDARHVLERAHAEREELLQQAEAAARAKDEFLAMLGHELRNPLSPIVTALHVMRLRQDSITQKEQATIQRQVDHLVRLVDDLLDVATITRGKVRLKRSSSLLSEVLAKAVEMAGSLLDERHHVLTIDVPPRPVMWWGDAARLAQVVANLLTNAARYTPPDGRIALTAAEEGDTIVIRVRDNGIGISAELLPHVFEMFFQGRRGLDRAEGGLGLGLALVKNLVAMHGGTAQALSEGPGQGSEFIVRLPLRPVDQAAEGAGPAPAPAAVDPPKRVLIVDDNRDAAESLAMVLRLDGHTVRVALQPLTGLALAEDFEPEVAILDIGLPQMDGYELARRIRDRFDASCLLIALSGYGQEGDRQRSASSGFAAHLVKPVDIEHLRRVLRTPSLHKPG